MFENFKTNDGLFYELFEENAKNINQAAIQLKELISNLKDIESTRKNIEDLEHKSDLELHKIMELLNKTFITPIDREDIYMIAKEMDNICDFIDSTASRFILFNIHETTEESKQISNLIVDSTKEMVELMHELKDAKKSKLLPQKIIEINRIEDDGDTIFRQAIQKLFQGNEDTLNVIKWREIYGFLENTLDSCEDVANIIEGVVMKYA